MDNDTINAIAEAVVEKLKKAGFIHKGTVRPVVAKEELGVTDTYKANAERVKQLIDSGEFEKPQYDYNTETGPFDWRYVIDKGKRLTATKYMLALYWNQKGKSDVPEWSKYKFAGKDRAGAAMQAELADAKRLASAILFKDLPALVVRADQRAYDEKTEEYKWEWKLSTLIKELKND